MTGAAAATVGAAVIGLPEVASATNGGGTPSADKIARLFAKLPGTVAYRIYAPATKRTARYDVSAKAGRQLFIETDPATVIAWAAASSKALQLVKDGLAS